MNTTIEIDYKKWILFNNQLIEFQNLYELYTAVEAGKSKGSVNIEINENADGNNLVITQVGYETSLEIRGNTDRNRFLEFLSQYYFPNEEVEIWYQQKTKDKEKRENHTPLQNTDVSKIDFIVHPKENQYYKLRVFFSVCCYLILIGIAINSFLTSISSGIITLITFLGVFVFSILINKITQGFFIGYIKGSSVKLNENQYPEVYKIVNDQAKLIGLDKIPEVYITNGHFNAFVTKFARKKFLVLYSEVLETITKGDFEVLKFVVGHELGHIKRKHLNREKWLSPSVLIPFLKQAHSRGCEYTCDRIGYHFSEKGATEGVLILATGKAIYSKINSSQYLKDSYLENSFWVWLSEKFLSHPYAFKRLSNITSYSKTTTGVRSL